MKRFAYLFIICSIISFASVNPVSSATSTDGVQVDLGVDGCNNNGICEAFTGETILSCPNDCSPPPASTGGSGGSSGPKFIFNVVVSPGINQAVINFKTGSPSFATLKWGTTTEYNTGGTRSTLFVTDHSVTIFDLEPSTPYFFQIEAVDKGGRVIMSYKGMFVTLPIEGSFNIPNPTNVRTNISREGITLRWNNPSDPHFKYVRVVRHEDRFYSSPFAGEVVYEGNLGRVLDRDVEVGRKYYYTLFSRGDSQDFSSGVGVAVLFDFREDAPLVLPPAPIKEGGLLPHFIILQNGKQNIMIGGIYEIDSNEPVVIENTAKTLEGFEDLWVEITDPSLTSTRAYLFKYDIENKIHRANIPALKIRGTYEIRIYGFNKDHTVLLSEGFIHVRSNTTYPEVVRNIKKIDVIAWGPWVLLLVAFILLLRKRFQP
jgi:hypothetical protein